MLVLVASLDGMLVPPPASTTAAEYAWFVNVQCCEIGTYALAFVSTDPGAACNLDYLLPSGY